MCRVIDFTETNKGKLSKNLPVGPAMSVCALAPCVCVCVVRISNVLRRSDVLKENA